MAAPRSGTPVLLGMGANLGEPLAQLAAAVARVGELVTLERVSGVYRSEPVGYADQPDFLNLALSGTTRLGAAALLDSLHAVERELGRVRTFRNAPRTLDVDLLAYGEEVIDAAGLTVPHPRLHTRAFVLLPLMEIVPEWRHPLLGRTAAELLAAAGAVERVERVGDPPRPAKGGGGYETRTRGAEES